jgi:Shedu protein SduA, C-terminal
MKDDMALWRAIYALYCLLMSRSNFEDEYQRFFERHPVAFSAFDIDEAKSFEKRSSHSLPFDEDRKFQPEPDFIGVDRASGNVTVVELKTPFVGDITTARADGNRAKFKANTESYISQATEYVDSIRERSDARAVIKTAFGIEAIAAYNIILIYALSEENNPTLVSELASQRKIPTRVIFYDTLLEQLVASYSTARRDIFSRPGWCFVFHICTPPKQAYRRTYLGEYGTGHADRLSILFDRDGLVFECLDSEGQLHQLCSALTGTGPHYIRFEFSNDLNGIYMSLNVNNEEQDLRVGRRSLKFSPDTSAFILGADSQGGQGALFFLLEHYSINRTLNLDEKIKSFHYFERKTQGTLRCLEFKPESYMVRDPSGHLAAGRDEAKPILREWRVGQEAYL